MGCKSRALVVTVHASGPEDVQAQGVRWCKAGREAGPREREALMIFYGTHYQMLCTRVSQCRDMPSLLCIPAPVSHLCAVCMCIRVLQALESTVKPAPTYLALYQS